MWQPKPRSCAIVKRFFYKYFYLIDSFIYFNVRLMSDEWRTNGVHIAYIGMPLASFHREIPNMQRVTLRLPEQQLKMIDMLVEVGEFPSASEAIRTAIRDLIDQRSEKLVGRMKLFEKAQEQSKNVDTFLRLKEEEQ